MSGGAIAIMITALIVLLVVALASVAIAFVFKYGIFMILGVIITKIFGSRKKK